MNFDGDLYTILPTNSVEYLSACWQKGGGQEPQGQQARRVAQHTVYLCASYYYCVQYLMYLSKRRWSPVSP